MPRIKRFEVPCGFSADDVHMAVSNSTGLLALPPEAISQAVMKALHDQTNGHSEASHLVSDKRWFRSYRL